MLIKDMAKSNNFPIKGLQITDKLAQIGEEADSPMKCDIINIKINDPTEDVYCLYLDFKPYEEFNKSVAIPSFWDSNRKPTLTWFKSGYYKDGKVEVYVMGTDEFNDFFIKKTVEQLHDEFYNTFGVFFEASTSQYIEWLEKKVLNN